jgi:hypothetical protein
VVSVDRLGLLQDRPVRELVEELPALLVLFQARRR